MKWKEMHNTHTNDTSDHDKQHTSHSTTLYATQTASETSLTLSLTRQDMDGKSNLELFWTSKELHKCVMCNVVELY